MKNLLNCFLFFGILYLSFANLAYSQSVVSGETYKIVARHSGKALEVLNGGTTNGTAIQQAEFADFDYQKWILTELSGGYWRISPVHRSNAALRRNGTKLELRSYADEASRQWSLVDAGDGYYRIMAKDYDGCVTISGGSADDGAIAWVENSDDNLWYQQFSFQLANGLSPTLSLNPVSIPFGYVAVNGTSAEESYTLTGSNLTPSTGNVTITAPIGFEVSATSGSGFAASIVVGYSGGTIDAKTIFVRFKPTSVLNYSGFISNAGGGAATRDLEVNGIGADFSNPQILLSKDLLPFGYTIVNESSRVLNYSVSGFGLNPASGTITVNAPEGFEVSNSSETGFVSTLTLPYNNSALLETTIYVRLKPGAIKNYSGSITNSGGGATTQNVAVSGISINTPSPLGPDGFGQNTTGGAGGTEVTVANTAEFLDYISRPGKYIIKVSGTIQLSGMHDVTSDKSIIGIGDSAVLTGGGLNIGLPIDDAVTTPPANRIKNVIIQNLTIKNPPEDCINVQMYSENVWINHCTFTNPGDGGVDIKRGSDWVTVSWCHFYNIVKVSLVGHSDDNAFQSAGRLHVTYHHNTFYMTGSRQPRARYGKVHVYNNLYYDLGDYAIGVGYMSNVYSEANYFYAAKDVYQLMFEGDNWGYLTSVGNLYEGDCGAISLVQPAAIEKWDPFEYYWYAPNTALWVKDSLYGKTGASGTSTSTTEIYSLNSDVTGQGHINPSNGTYPSGTEITLTATPEDGWKFQNWSGDITGTENPVSFKINSNITVTANFILKTSVFNANDYSGIKIYPNPVNCFLNIELASDFPKDATIQVFNSTGQSILNFSQNDQKKYINVEKLLPGIYLVKAISNKEIAINHFIKK